MITPHFFRRLASFLYDFLLWVAIMLVAALVFILIFNPPRSPAHKLFFQLFLLLPWCGYFLWCWLHGGQTLAMKTWRIKLVNADGTPLRLNKASLRLLYAFIGIAAAGLSLFWALFDREKQFLHDRLAGTRLIKAGSEAAT